MDIAAVNSETTTLNNLNNALVAQVLRNDSIPSEGVWAGALANWMGLPSSCITTNARNHARVYLVDSGGWLGANLPTTGYYAQPPTGTTINNSARIMIVSSLSADLPVSSGRPSAASFNDIWNTAPKAIPSTWTTWKGRGDDLLIQRINLQPLFSQLILASRDANNTASFVVAGQATSVAGHSISNAFYLNGTEVDLGSTVSGNTTLQVSFVLNGNSSYVFEGGTWGAQIGNGVNLVPPNTDSVISANFKSAVKAFLAAPDSPDNANPNGAAGDQEQVVAAMSDFMNVYALWSGEGFTTHGMTQGQAKNHLSIYNYLQNAQTWLSHTAGNARNITTPPYYSGLLY